MRADDAWEVFTAIVKSLPRKGLKATHQELVRLLWVVRNHPLSIHLIANLLRTTARETVETQLRELMVASENPVVASLELSLKRLDADILTALPLLGIFQGGALDTLLLHITELSKEQLSKLLTALHTTGLIHPIAVAENVIYYQFHPTLAPVLWTRLTPDQQTALRQRYQQFYYELSNYFYTEDKHNPQLIRTLVKLELSNLLAAVKGALQDRSEMAVDFVGKLNLFLGYFGLQRDRAVLTQQAATLAGVRGSATWYLSKTNQGQQFYDNGQYAAAATLFAEMLETLSAVSYQRCTTLHRLGCCLNKQGQTAEAIDYYQQELSELEQLTPSDSVVLEKSTVHTDLADALRNSGQFDLAKQHYKQSLAIDEQSGDQRGKVVTNGQLGTLALLQGDLTEAERRHQTMLELFQQLHEPLGEATAWHQLGYVYQAARRWEEAEKAYREAARIREAQGQLQSAAQTWNNLAMVTKNMGKWTEAERWYRKAVAGLKTAGDSKSYAEGLNNLANLLQQNPAHLSDARDLAEQALAIKKTLDPAATEIWKSYGLLAEIAEKQGDSKAASAYRRLSREAKLNYAGTQYELEQYRDLILAVIRGENVETELQRYGEGWENLKTAIRQILAGERDAETLCEPLNFGEAPIVLAILAGLAER
ncbi:MAG: tetratricopeptide repeat protein [Thiotrichaceae bacterium]